MAHEICKATENRLFNINIYGILFDMRTIYPCYCRKLAVKICFLQIFAFSLYGVSCEAAFQQPTVKWSVENLPYGIEERQTLNVLFPKEGNEGHAIVYLHGGFYFAGNKLWFPSFLTEFSENNIFATIGYRLIDNQLLSFNDSTVSAQSKVCIDDMLADVHNALLKLRQSANDNGYYIKSIILVGHSAGGHLSLLYSYKYLQENDPEGIIITAVVNLAGPSDYSDDFGWSSMGWYGNTVEARLQMLSTIGSALAGYPIELRQYNWASQNNFYEYLPHVKRLSPIMYINEHANIPPTLIVHGLEDRCVPYSNSVKLSAALERYSVIHRFITTTGSASDHMLGGSPAGLESITPITYNNVAWVDETIAWINQFVD